MLLEVGNKLPASVLLFTIIYLPLFFYGGVTIPFSKLLEDEDCHEFELECDVCSEVIKGHEMELLEKGWEWSSLESISTEKRSCVEYLAKITVATCPKHSDQHGDLLLKKMFSLEEHPPVGAVP